MRNTCLRCHLNSQRVGFHRRSDVIIASPAAAEPRKCHMQEIFMRRAFPLQRCRFSPEISTNLVLLEKKMTPSAASSLRVSCLRLVSGMQPTHPKLLAPSLDSRIILSDAIQVRSDDVWWASVAIQDMVDKRCCHLLLAYATPRSPQWINCTGSSSVSRS